MSLSPPLVAEITTLSALEIADQIASRSLSAREVVESHIQRIEAVNSLLNAVVVPLFDEARSQAEAADAAQRRGETLGPLHGVPVTVKESFDVAGTPTTLGLTHRSKHRARRDGLLVARLRRAGAIILGKTNVPQLLMGNETDNPLYGQTNNPWNLRRTPGGSSGGEAAIIAAGGSPLGLGSDIGGSIRFPAHACGVHCLKPSSGRLTMSGHAPVFEGQEAIICQPGPLARSVADLYSVMKILGAPGVERIDPSVPPVPWGDPALVSLEGLRIATYTDNGLLAVAPALRRAVREAGQALRAQGAEVEEWQPPDVPEAMRLYFGLLMADGMAGAKRALQKSRADWRIKGYVRSVAFPGSFTRALSYVMAAAGQHHLARAMRWGLGKLSTDAYWQLVTQRTQYRSRFMAELDDRRFDAIICPPDALPALTHGSSFYLSDALSYEALYNLLGLPAGVVAATRVQEHEEVERAPSRDLVERTARQVEINSAGLPVGVQVVARHWREDVVFAVMASLEQYFRAQPHYPSRPPLPAPLATHTEA